MKSLYYKDSEINKNLNLPFPWFFFLYACWFYSQRCSGKGGIGYTNHDLDNDDYKKMCKEKKFVYRDFKITNGKSYVFRLSVEKGGQFKILHHDEFIHNLGFLSTWLNDNMSDAFFDDKKESIHFEYVSDEFCEGNEVVILSMQFFDL